MFLEIKRPDDKEYFNLCPYILAEELKWKLTDADSENAGRTMDVYAHRDRLAQKIRLDIVLRPISLFDLRFICKILHEEFFLFRWDDPERGIIEGEAYKSEISGHPVAVYDDGTEIWGDVSFPIVER